MGEVYRARDTRLDRTVALKVLPDHVAQDRDLRQRFDREARAVSSLNHPHICALFDVGQQDGADFLVMELLDGETLADRLARGPLPLDQVLRYGIELADALDKAHRHGIVHRDLKPGNIMLTKAGTKLLDFGLAKLRAPSGDGTGRPPAAVLSEQPTAERPLTERGAVMGTFQYMSPEQLEGHEADARSDIFALGATLYEMATGVKAFRGKSRASLIAAILSGEPAPLSSLQPLTPPALERLVKVCLAKDPDDRLQTAHDVMQELKWIVEAGSTPGGQAPIATRARTRERIAWIIASAALLAVAGLLVRAMRPPAVGSVAVRRFEVGFPPKGTEVNAPTLTPDGSALVFLATLDGVTSLWVRPLDSLDARALPGTEGADDFVLSSDSRSVAFWVKGRQLKKMPLAGGTPLTICSVDYPVFGLNGWSRDGTLLFGVDQRIYKVSGSGGMPIPVTTADPAGGWQSYPSFLPDGRHFVYFARTGNRGQEIRLASLDSPASRALFPSDTQAVYAPPGYLLFGRGASLLAQRFDAVTLTPQGEPAVVSDSVWTSGDWANFSVSENGLLAFQSGASARAQLSWYDRSGRPQGTVGPPDLYFEPALSPDGSRLAVGIRNGPSSKIARISVFDLVRGSSTVVTPEPGAYVSPVWSHDGRFVLFGAGHVFPPTELHRHAADGTGTDEVLFKAGGPFATQDVSPDGRSLACLTLDQKTEVDIRLLSLDGRAALSDLVKTPKHESNARFSPDGRWLAYRSDDPPSAVYVQPHPPSGARWQVASAGSQPQWRADGKELFYLAPDRRLMAVAVETTESGFRAGEAKALFQTQVSDPDPDSSRNSYVVAANGQRFLVVRPLQEGGHGSFTVVLDWSADLGR